MAGRLAVALHDVEPATFERCALMRDWLDDHGVDRVTLLVVPAPGLHPFNDRSPELADWLAERQRGGDAVAQQGLAGGRGFAARTGEDARRSVLAGHRLLHLAGIDAHGFVAPGYAYTPGLRAALAPTFRWWAELHRLWFDHGRRSAWAPALASPAALRAGAWLAGEWLRIDLRPSQLDEPGSIATLERVLRQARRRVPATYDELWTSTS